MQEFSKKSSKKVQKHKKPLANSNEGLENNQAPQRTWSNNDAKVDNIFDNSKSLLKKESKGV